jgi:hypothetical protein
MVEARTCGVLAVVVVVVLMTATMLSSSTGGHSGSRGSRWGRRSSELDEALPAAPTAKLTAESTPAAASAVGGAEKPPPKARFLLLTGYPDGFRLSSKERDFATWSAVGVLSYSALHNDTDGVVLDSRTYTHPKGEHWWRIPALREYLPRYEWAMWVDADTTVNDFSIDLDEFVRDVSEDTILIVRIVNIPGISNDVNTGVFMIRNHPEAFELLKIWNEMPPAKPVNGFQDQSDLIAILNFDGRVSSSHPRAIHGDRFWKQTKFQDRDGLLLQHYAGNCHDHKPPERGFVNHYPGTCTPNWTHARSEFCKSYSRTGLMRGEVVQNPRSLLGPLTRQQLAALTWAIEQCTNREELDELRQRLGALEAERRR